jgi:hypothetical protein
MAVQLSDGNSEIFIGTRDGMSIRFPEDDIRAMGRTAYGVRGISLREGDEVASAFRRTDGADRRSPAEAGPYPPRYDPLCYGIFFSAPAMLGVVSEPSSAIAKVRSSAGHDIGIVFASTLYLHSSLRVWLVKRAAPPGLSSSTIVPLALTYVPWMRVDSQPATMIPRGIATRSATKALIGVPD